MYPSQVMKTTDILVGCCLMYVCLEMTGQSNPGMNVPATSGMDMRNYCSGGVCHSLLFIGCAPSLSQLHISPATAAPLVMTLHQEVKSKAACSQDAGSISRAFRKTLRASLKYLHWIPCECFHADSLP